MSEKFFALKKEKQERILQAALQEFGSRSYEDASTNVIVQSAGISKGALFQYFPNKLELYSFLVHYSYEMLQQKFLTQVDWTEQDLLVRCEKAWYCKMRLMQEQPWLFDFLLRTLHDRPPELAEEVDAIYEKNVHTMAMLQEDYDDSLFRQDCASEQIYSLIQYAIEGYGMVASRRIAEGRIEELNLEQLSQEFQQFLQLLRHCLYREAVQKGEGDYDQACDTGRTPV